MYDSGAVGLPNPTSDRLILLFENLKIKNHLNKNPISGGGPSTNTAKIKNTNLFLLNL